MSKDLCGYFGKQLRISLDTKETSVEEIDSAVLKKYLGGVGYGARVLYDEIKKGNTLTLPILCLPCNHSCVLWRKLYGLSQQFSGK